MNDFESALNDLLVDTFNTILKYESQSLKDIGGVTVTIGEAHMIDAIARLDPPVTISQVAARMQLAMPTTTIAVKKLEQKGYVEKAASAADGRRVTLILTDQGKRVDRAHTIFHQRMVRNISSLFAPEEQTILLGAIGQLKRYFIHQTKADS